MELEGGLFARSVEVDDPQRARWAAAEAVATSGPVDRCS